VSVERTGSKTSSLVVVVGRVYRWAYQAQQLLQCQGHDVQDQGLAWPIVCLTRPMSDITTAALAEVCGVRLFLLHCALASGAVYCNRSCLCVCVCVFLAGGPLFQVRGPYMVLDPSLFVRFFPCADLSTLSKTHALVRCCSDAVLQ